MQFYAKVSWHGDGRGFLHGCFAHSSEREASPYDNSSARQRKRRSVLVFSGRTHHPAKLPAQGGRTSRLSHLRKRRSCRSSALLSALGSSSVSESHLPSSSVPEKRNWKEGNGTLGAGNENSWIHHDADLNAGGRRRTILLPPPAISGLRHPRAQRLPFVPACRIVSLQNAVDLSVKTCRVPLQRTKRRFPAAFQTDGKTSFYFFNFYRESDLYGMMHSVLLRMYLPLNIYGKTRLSAND